MKIFCRICKRRFESAAVSSPNEVNGATRAADDSESGKIFGQMAEHLKNKHAREAEDVAVTLATCHAMIAVYLLLEYVAIPPDETDLLERIEKLEDELAGLLGFEIDNTAEIEVHAVGDVPLN